MIDVKLLFVFNFAFLFNNTFSSGVIQAGSHDDIQIPGVPKKSTPV